jgi:hypothetical protein
MIVYSSEAVLSCPPACGFLTMALPEEPYVCSDPSQYRCDSTACRARVPAVTPNLEQSHAKRWDRWERKSAISARRNGIQVRVIAVVVFSVLLGWLAFELSRSPVRQGSATIHAGATTVGGPGSRSHRTPRSASTWTMRQPWS